MKIPVGLVDDHQLFLKSLSLMVESFGKYEVVVEALNGRELQQKLTGMHPVPELMLIDVNMPVMDGPQTAAWLQEQYPSIRMAAVSMNDKEQAILSMLKAGCCAYLLKDAHPNLLEKALEEIMIKGYFNSDATNLNFRKLLQNSDSGSVRLTEKEKFFLQMACSELTYKQIAGRMQLSERTVDGYRETLFEKFNVQSRVGLCLEALRKGFVSLNNNNIS